jgi:hypothetical protein
MRSLWNTNFKQSIEGNLDESLLDEHGRQPHEFDHGQRLRNFQNLVKLHYFRIKCPVIGNRKPRNVQISIQKETKIQEHPITITSTPSSCKIFNFGKNIRRTISTLKQSIGYLWPCIFINTENNLGTRMHNVQKAHSEKQLNYNPLRVARKSSHQTVSSRTWKLWYR